MFFYRVKDWFFGVFSDVDNLCLNVEKERLVFKRFGFYVRGMSNWIGLLLLYI